MPGSHRHSTADDNGLEATWLKIAPGTRRRNEFVCIANTSEDALDGSDELDAESFSLLFVPNGRGQEGWRIFGLGARLLRAAAARDGNQGS
jgi:hypothetical protein